MVVKIVHIKQSIISKDWNSFFFVKEALFINFKQKPHYFWILLVFSRFYIQNKNKYKMEVIQKKFEVELAYYQKSQTGFF